MDTEQVMKVKEFIEKAENVIKLYKVKSLGEFDDSFQEEYPDEELKVVNYAQDVVEHRWYNTATNIYLLEDGFVGVRAGYKLYSEQMWWNDVDIEPIVSIYEACQTIAYRPKILN